MSLAILALVLVLAIGLAAFCAGWIAHEERDRR